MGGGLLMWMQVLPETFPRVGNWTDLTSIIVLRHYLLHPGFAGPHLLVYDPTQKIYILYNISHSQWHNLCSVCVCVCLWWFVGREPTKFVICDGLWQVWQFCLWFVKSSAMFFVNHKHIWKYETAPVFVTHKHLNRVILFENLLHFS